MARRIDLSQTFGAIESFRSAQEAAEARRQAAEAEDDASALGQLTTLGTLGGAAAGLALTGGSPQGAMLGASLGSAGAGIVGQQMGYKDSAATDVASAVTTGTQAYAGLQAGKANSATNTAFADMKQQQLDAALEGELTDERKQQIMTQQNSLNKMRKENITSDPAQFTSAVNQVIAPQVTYASKSVPITKDGKPAGSMEIVQTLQDGVVTASKPAPQQKVEGGFNVYDKSGKSIVQNVSRIAAAALANQNPTYEVGKFGQGSPVSVRKSAADAKKVATTRANNAALAGFTETVSSDPVQRTKQMQSMDYGTKAVLAGSGNVQEALSAKQYTRENPAEQLISNNRAIRATERTARLKALGNLPTPQYTKEVRAEEQTERKHQVYENEFARLAKEFGSGSEPPEFIPGAKTTTQNARDLAKDRFYNDFARKYDAGLQSITKDEKDESGNITYEGRDLTVSELEEAVSKYDDMEGSIAKKKGDFYKKQLEKRNKDINERGKTEKTEKERQWKVESQLRGEYQNLIEEYDKVEDKLSIIKVAAENGKDLGGVADMGLVFAYMKMLDPTSVVRESEYATAAKAPGTPEWVINLYNKSVDLAKGNPPKGELFTETARQRFATMAERTWEQGYSQRKKKYTDQYMGLATRAGVDPQNVTGIKIVAPGAGQPGVPGAGKPKVDPDLDYLLN